MRAAFFDLDKTVIDRASIAAFGGPFRKGGLINRRLVVRAITSQLIFLYFGADDKKLERVRETMLTITKGCYTGETAFYAYGANKATAIKELAERTGIDLAASTAYSDSISDLPMLETVGRPVCVNADRALTKIAREREWEIRQFTKPVRLRDRVPVTTPVLTTSLALAGAAVLLWRHGHRARPGVADSVHPTAA
jgi:phosphoserine phosphatase